MIIQALTTVDSSKKTGPFAQCIAKNQLARNGFKSVSPVIILASATVDSSKKTGPLAQYQPRGSTLNAHRLCKELGPDFSYPLNKVIPQISDQLPCLHG